MAFAKACGFHAGISLSFWFGWQRWVPARWELNGCRRIRGL